MIIFYSVFAVLITTLSTNLSAQKKNLKPFARSFIYHLTRSEWKYLTRNDIELDRIDWMNNQAKANINLALNYRKKARKFLIWGIIAPPVAFNIMLITATVSFPTESNFQINYEKEIIGTVFIVCSAGFLIAMAASFANYMLTKQFTKVARDIIYFPEKWR